MPSGNMRGDIVERLRGSCVGTPAKIEWPHRLLHEAADEIEQLGFKIKTVLETFERDEAQGYRSKDRQFAISILKD